MRTFSRIFDSFFRNKVNPDSKPLHVFYGENQNSKQPETEPKNNCESHEVVSISDEQENQTKTLKMTDAFKAEASSLWPAAAANITNCQVARFFDDHSNFFESTLCELFLNAYRHGKFKNLSIDTNEPDPQTVCKNLAKSIYTRYVLILIYVQTLASYVNGEWHYTPFGIFRRSSSAVYTVFVEKYGLEKGTMIFDQYRMVLRKFYVNGQE